MFQVIQGGRTLGSRFEMRRALYATVVVAMLVGASCGTTGGGATGAPTSVKIAVDGIFSGAEAALGLGVLHGTQLAVDQFNAKGGVHGTKVELEVGDDQGKGDVGVTLANKFAAEDNLLGVVGPMFSSICIATEPIYQRATLPFLTPSGTAAKVTQGGFSVAHRVMAHDDVQGPSDANFVLQTLHPKKVFVLDTNTGYSIPLADSFQSVIKAAGVQVARDSFPVDATDANPIATKIKAYAPDLVFFPNEGPQAPKVLQALRSQGVTIGSNFAWLGADGDFNTAEFIQGSQGAAEGAYDSFVAPDINSVALTNPAAAAFVSSYTAKYGQLGQYDAVAFEETNVLLQAINASPVNNGKISRADVLSNLNKTNYNGILGYPIKFDSKGDVQGLGVFIFQVKNGKFVQLKVEAPPS
jgi:branched-chain amino acid transport system substrate-binding protein